MIELPVEQVPSAMQSDFKIFQEANTLIINSINKPPVDTHKI